MELGADDMIGFEIGIVDSDWRPAATVGLVTGVAALTDMAAAVIIGGETGVFMPPF